jgi:hypothetical protein
LETRVFGMVVSSGTTSDAVLGLLLDNIVQNWNLGMDLVLDRARILD